MRENFDLSVYFVADPSLCGGRPVVDVVMAAVQGGASMVQYRNKSEDMAQILLEAAMLAELLKSHAVPLLINDHVNVAFAVGAAGVHLGQGDDDPAAARRRLGKTAIIGQTAYNKEQIEMIDPAVVDYIGTGPFYETHTKKGKPVLGADGFAPLAALSPVPVVGIGGIDPAGAKAVIDAGADGVAMMRSVSEADDPQAAARDFKEALNL